MYVRVAQSSPGQRCPQQASYITLRLFGNCTLYIVPSHQQGGCWLLVVDPSRPPVLLPLTFRGDEDQARAQGAGGSCGAAIPALVFLGDEIL